MGIRVVADLVAAPHNLASDRRVPLDISAHHEEGGFDILTIECVEDLGSVTRIRAVIERQCDDAVSRFDSSDVVAE